MLDDKTKVNIIECQTSDCISLLVENDNLQVGVMRFCNTIGNCDEPNYEFSNGTIVDCQVCEGNLCNSHEIEMDSGIEEAKLKLKFRPRPILPPIHGGGGGTGNSGNIIELFCSMGRLQLIVIVAIIFKVMK